MSYILIVKLFEETVVKFMQNNNNSGNFYRRLTNVRVPCYALINNDSLENKFGYLFYRVIIDCQFKLRNGLGPLLGCLKNTMNLDLAVFNKSLLLCNQWDILEISLLILSSITALLFK